MRTSTALSGMHGVAYLQQLFLVVGQLLIRALSVFSQSRVIQPSALFLEGLDGGDLHRS